MISSVHYHDSEHFSKELESIFKSNWLFVGTESELTKNNDFVTLDIGQYAIVVQNFRGTIKAYKNICLHRFMKLQTERKGNRPLFCHYHGWAYTVEGKPIVSQNFGSNAKEISFQKLEEYEIAKCGIFYFVKPSEATTQSLVEFLGDYYNFLQEISFAIGNELYNKPMPQKVNWKLIIENVLECYHCKTVHANSFVLQGYGVAQPDTFRHSAKHNDCEYPKKIAPKNESAKAGRLSFLNYRVRQNEVFHHTLIYPNMVISITEGSSYYIGNVIPISANESVLNVRIHAPKLIIPNDAPKVSEAMVNAFHEMASDSLITILNEDRTLLENVQSVVSKVDREPIFGKDEVRINNFYQSYFSDIEE